MCTEHSSVHAAWRTAGLCRLWRTPLAWYKMFWSFSARPDMLTPVCVCVLCPSPQAKKEADKAKRDAEDAERARQEAEKHAEIERRVAEANERRRWVVCRRRRVVASASLHLLPVGGCLLTQLVVPASRSQRL